MKTLQFIVMNFILLIIFLTFCGSVSASNVNILAENHIATNDGELTQQMVSVISDSMSPNIRAGDQVVVENGKDIITYGEAIGSGYNSFNLPGDVILYHPYGSNNTALSRALRYVLEGDPMWDGGPEAPFSGYITKGDHNEITDQQAGRVYGIANESYIKEHQDEIREVGRDVYQDMITGLIIYNLDNNTYVGEGICYLAPVKEDWVIGVARVPGSYTAVIGRKDVPV